MHLNFMLYDNPKIQWHRGPPRDDWQTRMENSKRSVCKAEATASTKRSARRHLPLPSHGLHSSGAHHGSWMPRARNTATRLVVLVWLETIWRRKISEKMMPTRSDRNRHFKLRASTSTMPSFDMTSRFGKDFSHWLSSDNLTLAYPLGCNFYRIKLSTVVYLPKIKDSN